ncbi:hypothetical protein P7K49_000166 [Saguinus oedipus]|uniref:Uncharacterized protein n=1 Tax=Saguinus oedipus TaxID=9490 RepID=A0ABQ9WBB9_SAGOE|nr:hypothetical protein P7K49_000166 [Saguinus oedipus]
MHSCVCQKKEYQASELQHVTMRTAKACSTDFWLGNLHSVHRLWCHDELRVIRAPTAPVLGTRKKGFHQPPLGINSDLSQGAIGFQDGERKARGFQEAGDMVIIYSISGTIIKRNRKSNMMTKPHRMPNFEKYILRRVVVETYKRHSRDRRQMSNFMETKRGEVLKVMEPTRLSNLLLHMPVSPAPTHLPPSLLSSPSPPPAHIQLPTLPSVPVCGALPQPTWLLVNWCVVNRQLPSLFLTEIQPISLLPFAQNELRPVEFIGRAVLRMTATLWHLQPPQRLSGPITNPRCFFKPFQSLEVSLLRSNTFIRRGRILTVVCEWHGNFVISESQGQSHHSEGLKDLCSVLPKRWAWIRPATRDDIMEFHTLALEGA